jgi:hypothetical protein
MLLPSIAFLSPPSRGAVPQASPAKPEALPMTTEDTDSSALPRCAVDPKDAKEWTTADHHLTVVLHPGTTLILAPHTRVLRLPMIPTALGGREFAKTAYNIELVTGRVDVEIDPSRRPIYGLIVRTARKVGAIVKHGRATVSVHDGNVTVAARSGKEMMTAIGERWRPLRVGRAFVVNDSNPEGLNRALLAAPIGKVDQAVAVAVGASMTPQRLSWNEIPQNHGYVVQVFRKSANAAALVAEARVKTTSHTLQRLDAGRYYATIASIDESDLESSPSAAIAFRVVEAVLPPGASVDGAVIQLPMAERLRLLEVEDLELSYGKRGEDFVAAPPSIGLHDGGPVRIRLRERGSAHETQLALEPLDVVPSIELGPRRAQWPGPPVTIDVVTRRRDGSPAEAEPFFHASVTVNSEPVNVIWQKTPGRMSFRLDKPSHRGPWIVRVMLHDARGREVARDFLEVAEAPTSSGLIANAP